MEFERYIRTSRLPQDGVIFKDTRALADRRASGTSSRRSLPHTRMRGSRRSSVPRPVVSSSRSACYALGAGFVPARKPGKLPWNTTAHTYDLEYGTDSLEVT
jgi:adenine phosphoribosyltransferase